MLPNTQKTHGKTTVFVFLVKPKKCVLALLHIFSVQQRWNERMYSSQNNNWNDFVNYVVLSKKIFALTNELKVVADQQSVAKHSKQLCCPTAVFCLLRNGQVVNRCPTQ